MSLSGITYYNDFVDINSINNPLVDNDVRMQFNGFFDKNWTRNGIDFDNIGYGLKKTINNQGFIYCDDSSRLFSLSSGYVGILMSFPYSFVDGVYQLLINDTQILNEYILWGVNIGQYQNAQPGFYAALTPRGIEWTIWTSVAKDTLRDELTTENANTDIFFEFIWDMSQIDDYFIRAILRINGTYSAISNIPIENDNINDLSFCALNTPFSYSNLECTIKKLIIYNTFPPDDFHSTSSSSGSSSSYSESSISSYIHNWSSSSLSSPSETTTSSTSTSSSSSSFGISSSSISSTSSSSTSSTSNSSITISFSSASTPSSESSSESTEFISESSISSTSSSSLSSTSSTSLSLSSSSSSCPNCNNCSPKLEYYYTVTISGFTGDCATFNGAWVLSYRGTLGCDWTYTIDADYMIILWWDDGSSAWYVLLTCPSGGTLKCGVTTIGTGGACEPTGSYTGGEGTVIVS